VLIAIQGVCDDMDPAEFLTAEYAEYADDERRDSDDPRLPRAPRLNALAVRRPSCSVVMAIWGVLDDIDLADFLTAEYAECADDGRRDIGNPRLPRTPRLNALAVRRPSCSVAMAIRGVLDDMDLADFLTAEYAEYADDGRRDIGNPRLPCAPRLNALAVRRPSCSVAMAIRGILDDMDLADFLTAEYAEYADDGRRDIGIPRLPRTPRLNALPVRSPPTELRCADRDSGRVRRYGSGRFLDRVVRRLRG